MRLLWLVPAVCAAVALPGCAAESAPPPAARHSPAPAQAERPAGAGLVERLRQGGFILYMRHAATESTEDDPTPDFRDPGTQRLLSAAGRDQARDIGRAVRRLGLPVGRVLASPYHRTVQTGELAFGAGRVETVRALTNEAYPGTDDDELAAGLRRLIRTPPVEGTNTVLVSHGFNLMEVTGLVAAEGETVIFDPAGRDPLEPVGRITARQWRSLTGGG